MDISFSIKKSWSRSWLLLGLAWVVGCAEVDVPTPEPAKVPVRSQVLEPTSFRPSLRLYGKVEPAARLQLLAPAAGRVSYEPRFANGFRIGERVTAGESLFRVDNEALRLHHVEAELALRGAEAELERTRLGVEGGFLAAADLKRREIDTDVARERLASAIRELERLQVLSPGNGVLWVEKRIAAGSEILAGTLLAEVASDGKSRVEAWATTNDLQRLERGFEVECLAPGAGKVVGRGRLSEVARQVDARGTVRLVVTVDDDLGLPPPGEGLELRVILSERLAALTLPEEALLVDGGVAAVFVLEPSGSDYKARLRPVRPGSRSGGRVEILDGVSEGERVAIRGTEFLADGLLAVEAEDTKG
jgi:RND family efflux transporter MFP subunit